AGLLLERATCAPPAGAGPLRLTVPTELAPPVRVAGASESEPTTGGWMVSAAVCVVPPKEAEIVTGVAAATALVVTGKVAVLVPAATVTLAGTLAAPLLLASATCAPPEGAGPLNVTVATEAVPPVTFAGATTSDCTPGWAAAAGTSVARHSRMFTGVPESRSG